VKAAMKKQGNPVRTRAMKIFQIILVVAVLSSPALLTAAEPAAGPADEPKLPPFSPSKRTNWRHRERRHRVPHRKRQPRKCLRRMRPICSA